MKIFAKYLGYRLEKSLSRTLIFTILALAFTWSTVSECIWYTNPQDIQYNETGIYVLAIILGALCTVIPILELAELKNRRNLDTIYFFPIKRWKMALAQYLSGWIQTLVVYSVSFFSAWAYLEANTDYFALGYMFFYYILSLLVGLMMYSIFSFIFIQGNTVADGILFCMLWIFLIMIVGNVIRIEILREYIRDTVYWESSAGFWSDWGIIYSPINNLTVIFQDLIEINKDTMDYYYRSEYVQRYLQDMYMFFVWGALGIAATAGYFLTFIKKGAEKAGEVSSSWLGYRILIPVYGYSCLMSSDTDIILIVLVLAMMVIGYTVYRRSFKLKTSDIVVTACGIIPLIIGSLL